MWRIFPDDTTSGQFYVDCRMKTFLYFCYGAKVDF